MSVRKIKNHGSWVWQARVAYEGRRRAAFRKTKDEARTAEGELLAALKAEHGQAEQASAAPATLRQLFEYYVDELEARGKGEETVVRAAQTGLVIERLMPELLDRPVSRLCDAELFAFRNLRLREGKVIRERVGDEVRVRHAPAKPSTINRDLRTLRAMLKKVRPDYRFPTGVFLPEDETRVRWLRPEEEVLVLEPMASPFREIAKLAALTLMRLSEIRLLRREYIHLEQGVILLPQAKAGARPVILSAEAQKVLRGQLEGHKSDWLFPGPDGRPYARSYISRTFRKAARAAGLRDFHFHDLRHHGATMALNRGFTAPIVMALGGWKTEANDAEICRGDRSDAPGGGRGGQWERASNTCSDISLKQRRGRATRFSLDMPKTGHYSRSHFSALKVQIFQSYTIGAWCEEVRMAMPMNFLIAFSRRLTTPQLLTRHLSGSSLR